MPTSARRRRLASLDSVSQFVLGGSLAGVALAGRTRPWRAVVWGGVVATLPDLDVLFDHGDAIANMTRHRAESHSLFWLSLLSPLLAWAIAALQRERHQWRRWWWAVWLALVTHPLLDAMTIYGTQWGLPFTDRPFAVGSLFVIDPLYTLPLAIGIAGLLAKGGVGGARWNRGGLVASTVYAAWSLLAQHLATDAARASLVAQGIVPRLLVVTPAPLQTVLWRIVAVTEQQAFEGFWSVCDGDRPVTFVAIDRGAADLAALRGNAAADRLRWFSDDCTKAERQGHTVRITDLRMGQEPYYMFSFVVADVDRDGGLRPVAAPQRSGGRIDVGKGLAWLWARMWGGEVPTPR